jgi:hypothetical protein
MRLLDVTVHVISHKKEQHLFWYYEMYKCLQQEGKQTPIWITVPILLFAILGPWSISVFIYKAIQQYVIFF